MSCGPIKYYLGLHFFWETTHGGRFKVALKRPSGAGKRVTFINENQSWYCEYMSLLCEII